MTGVGEIVNCRKQCSDTYSGDHGGSDNNDDNDVASGFILLWDSRMTPIN